MADALPASLVRTTDYLTHETFHSYRSETQMLRYLRRLSGRDYALDRGMIPLGSCTMKLNATSEMAPVSWPEFCDLHPFAPADQTRGYTELFADLERWLAAITGFAAVALQSGRTAPEAKMLSKPFHLKDLVAEVDRMFQTEDQHGRL